MDVTADLEAPCSAARLFQGLDDLATYPEWLEIVERAEVAPSHPDDDGDAAWLVDLRGRLGPLARSKRLRMVRTHCEAPERVRFERREHDGRQHSAWVLEAEVEPLDPASPDDPSAPAPPGDPGAASRLVMRLHYGGGFGSTVLEKLLSDAIERSRPVLLARVSS